MNETTKAQGSVEELSLVWYAIPHNDHTINIYIQEIIVQVDSYVLSQNTTGKPDRTRA